MKVADRFILSLAYTAVALTSAFGFIIALHQRRRQKEKFKIIGIYELRWIIMILKEDGHEIWKYQRI
jgi:hypothetical protein